MSLHDGHEVVVADATTPKPISLVVKYSYSEEGLKISTDFSEMNRFASLPEMNRFASLPGIALSFNEVTFYDLLLALQF